MVRIGPEQVDDGRRGLFAEQLLLHPVHVGGGVGEELAVALAEVVEGEPAKYIFQQTPWDNARTAIEQYVGAKKGYKKNKYQYSAETRKLVEDNWQPILDLWGYKLD